MTRGRAVIAAVTAVVTAVLWLAIPHARGLSLVVRAADLRGIVRAAADLDAEPIRQRELHIPGAKGPLRARAYEPSGGFTRTAVLITGLHPADIDEPRLVALSRHLAASGIAVVTPDIPELSRFEISPDLTDSIGRAALWVAGQPHFAPDGRVGLMGISFSGGLSLVAAGREPLRNRLSYVFAFGAHYDLPGVLRYLAGQADDGGPPRPHDYGVAVLLLTVADRMVPEAQVDALRDAVRQFLWASHLDRARDPGAGAAFAELRERALTLPEPSATLLRYVNARDVARLGARLLPHVEALSVDPALSPSRAPKPSAPVFLLHGTADRLIPASESRKIAESLRGHAPVRLLVTGLLAHADIGRPPRLHEVLQLAGFWGDILSR